MATNIHVTREDTKLLQQTPVGNLTPAFIGQCVLVPSEDSVFYAIGVTNRDWLQSGASKADVQGLVNSINGIIDVI